MPATSTPPSPFPASPPNSGGVVVPLAGVWRVRMLGGFEARNGDLLLTHFVSRPIAALLARLALQPQRSHPREELTELLWPGVDLDVGRNRLRNAVSSLRRLLEPPGVVAGAVLVADRQSIALARNASSCDAIDFERAVRAGDRARARALYRGELLPGVYDDWAHDERTRLAALFDQVDAHDAPGPGAPAVPVSSGGADATAPVWPLTALPRPALPTYLTRFFGRAAERERLLAMTEAQRLVTLSGTGGCGKTRLAVEVARRADGFGLIAFVALADCVGADQFTAQLRVALQLPKADGDPLDQAVSLLLDQRALLVLDNFEQLVRARDSDAREPGGVPVVEALLARVPTLHLLVTSRRVLGIDGEHELALQPLSAPDAQGSVEQVAGNASVSLFVDRARSVRPDFQVTAANCKALAGLCQALEGLPLAIELAASRSRAFSPADMHAALARRFTLLTRGGVLGGRPGARHDSLRTAIDWSWRLLSPPQQAFLVALSVFRGGWSTAGAMAVTDAVDAHELLEALTADSLLRSDADSAGAMRFFMLEMIREYLREQLSVEESLRLRQRHRAQFVEQARRLGRKREAAPRDELPNLVEAMQTAVDDDEPLTALALGVALQGEWEQHGMAPQVRGLLARALDLAAGASDGVDEPAVAGRELSADALRVHVHLALRAVLLQAGESDAAQAQVDRALSIAGSNERLRAAALLGQARQLWERARTGAPMRPILAEALQLSRQQGMTETEAGALSALATLVFHDDQRPAEAFELFDRAQRLYESVGIHHLATRMLLTKANCLTKLDRCGAALGLLDACERRLIAAGQVSGLPELANVQGFVYSHMVRWRDSERAFARCALVAAAQQNRYTMALGLWNLARPLAHRRDPDAAALLLAFTIRFWISSFGALVESDLRYVAQVRRLIRVQIGAAAVENVWRRADAMTLPDALSIARRSADPADG